MSKVDWEELDELLSELPPEERHELAESYFAWIKRSNRLSGLISWAGAVLIGGAVIWLMTLHDWGKSVPLTAYIVAACCIAAGFLLFRTATKLERRWMEKNPFRPNTNL